MNAVGIDVSKGKSTVAILRPFGEVVRLPFDVLHDYGSLERLADQIICLDGESRVLMEATGRYHEPVAAALHERGISKSLWYVSLESWKMQVPSPQIVYKTFKNLRQYPGKYSVERCYNYRGAMHCSTIFLGGYRMRNYVFRRRFCFESHPSNQNHRRKFIEYISKL